MGFESMERRELFTADLGMDLALVDAGPEPTAQDRADYFIADSVSFGIEREIKESGEKAGGEVSDGTRSGVGELQECTISKSTDTASVNPAPLALTGNSPGTAEIDFVEVAGDAATGGSVDTADYAIWTKNFGSTTDPAASSSSVDEVLAESDETASCLTYELENVIVTSYR